MAQLDDPTNEISTELREDLTNVLTILAQRLGRASETRHRKETTMHRTLTNCGIILVALTLLADWAAGGQPEPTVNFAQVDRVDPWVCAASPSSPLTFTDIPGLSVALTTTGGPVLMTLTIDAPTFWGGGIDIVFEPVINMQPRVSDQLTVSNANTWSWPFVFTRIYPLMAGTHTFSGRLACNSNPANLSRAWLTVYELPSIRK